MLAGFDAAVQQAADSRYDLFLDRFLEWCVELPPEAQQELVFLLRTRGGLPKLKTISKWISRRGGTETAKTLEEFKNLRAKAGFTATGGGIHNIQRLSPEKRRELLTALRTCHSKLYAWHLSCVLSLPPYGRFGTDPRFE